MSLKVKSRLFEKFFGVGDFSPENNEVEAIGSQFFVRSLVFSGLKPLLIVIETILNLIQRPHEAMNTPCQNQLKVFAPASYISRVFSICSTNIYWIQILP